MSGSREKQKKTVRRPHVRPVRAVFLLARCKAPALPLAEAELGCQGPGVPSVEPGPDLPVPALPLQAFPLGDVQVQSPAQVRQGEKNLQAQGLHDVLVRLRNVLRPDGPQVLGVDLFHSENSFHGANGAGMAPAGTEREGPPSGVPGSAPKRV